MFIQHNFFTNISQPSEILLELQEFKQAMNVHCIKTLPNKYKVKPTHNNNMYHLKLHNGTARDFARFPVLKVGTDCL